MLCWRHTPSPLVTPWTPRGPHACIGRRPTGRSRDSTEPFSTSGPTPGSTFPTEPGSAPFRDRSRPTISVDPRPRWVAGHQPPGSQQRESELQLARGWQEMPQRVHEVRIPSLSSTVDAVFHYASSDSKVDCTLVGVTAGRKWGRDPRVLTPFPSLASFRRSQHRGGGRESNPPGSSSPPLRF
jgi:hypothetical protein